MSDKISVEYAKILLDIYESALFKKYFPEKDILLSETENTLVSAVEHEKDKEAVRICLRQMKYGYDTCKMPYVVDMKKQVLKIISENCIKYEAGDTEKVLDMINKKIREGLEGYSIYKKC
jgi:hypothetical protein